MSEKNNDIFYGLDQEKKTLEILKLYFKDENIIKNNRFSIIDFESDSKLIELKSRRVKYNQYPTTIVGINKIEQFKKSNKKCYFIFNFIDGLYYIEYSSNFDKYLIKNEYIIRDGIKEYKKNCHIPINDLKKIVINF